MLTTLQLILIKIKQYRLSSLIIFSVVLFAASALYAYLLFTNTKPFNNHLNIFYVLTLSAAFFIAIFILRSVKNENDHLYKYLPVMVVFATHCGILMAFYSVQPSNTILWVPDSYSMHIPGAQNIADFIHGEARIRTTDNIFDKIYFTHVLVGIFFSIFGVNPVSSSIVLMFAKACTVFLIYMLGSKMFGKRTGAYGALLYATMPTVLFYTLVYYKEAIIHLIVAVIFLSAHSIVNEKKMIYLIPLSGSLLLLGNERFYLLPMFMVSIYLYSIAAKSIATNIKITIQVFVILVIAIFSYHYRYILNLVELSNLRDAYLSYPDVTSINKTLPYYASLIKLLFSPYITSIKFKLYGHLGLLLIWGSVPNQLAILFSIFGMYINVKNDFKNHFLIILPFIFFLLLFAYIAPYSGRQRDSFYPIIAVYAGFAINYMLNSMAAMKKKTRLNGDNERVRRMQENSPSGGK
jgi:hypothetical protein